LDAIVCDFGVRLYQAVKCGQQKVDERTAVPGGIRRPSAEDRYLALTTRFPQPYDYTLNALGVAERRQ
jgi:hypothetical protein